MLIGLISNLFGRAKADYVFTVMSLMKKVLASRRPPSEVRGPSASNLTGTRLIIIPGHSCHFALLNYRCCDEKPDINQIAVKLITKLLRVKLESTLGAPARLILS